jgi:hypothetical protein
MGVLRRRLFLSSIRMSVAMPRRAAKIVGVSTRLRLLGARRRSAVRSSTRSSSGCWDLELLLDAAPFLDFARQPSCLRFMAHEDTKSPNPRDERRGLDEVDVSERRSRAGGTKGRAQKHAGTIAHRRGSAPPTGRYRRGGGEEVEGRPVPQPPSQARGRRRRARPRQRRRRSRRWANAWNPRAFPALLLD